MTLPFFTSTLGDSTIIVMIKIMKSVPTTDDKKSEASRNAFNGIRTWVKRNEKVKSGKPLDEGDYRKHLDEKYGK